MKHSPLTIEQLDNVGSLITIKASNTCLGYLMNFKTGIIKYETYDASYGQVPVSKEDADTHNKELDKAMLQGMDNACQGESTPIPLYFDKKTKQLTTFIGTVLQGNVTATNGKVTLEKMSPKGLQIWQGKTHKNDDCITLKRMG